MTALVDQLESLGLAMDQGLISREEAVALLVEFRQGGLTPLGAADMLREWPEARARYEAIWRSIGGLP